MTIDQRSTSTPDEIRGQMTQTLLALTDKADLLQGEMRAALHETKDKVQDRIETVTNMFCLSHQVNKHPWQWLAGAVTLGVIVRGVLGRGQPARVTPPIDERAVSEASPNWATRRSALSRVLTEYDEEIGQTKKRALGSVVGLVSAFVKSSLPPRLGSHVAVLAQRTEKRLATEHASIQPNMQEKL